MNTKASITTLAALLALAGPAFSQSNWGSTGAVTVALSLSITKEALKSKDETGKVIPISDGGGPTYENSFSVETLGGPANDRVTVRAVSTDEYGSEIFTAKWGNAEILKHLVEEGVLPQKGKKPPFIAGWSIIAIYDAEGSPLSYVARHTDKTTIEIPMSITPGDPMASEKSEKTVTTDNTPINGNESSTTTHTFSEKYKGLGSASVHFSEGTLDVSGLLTGSIRMVVKSEGRGEDRVSTEVYVPGAVKLGNIVGASVFDDVVEGSISVEGATIVDLDAFTPSVDS